MFHHLHCGSNWLKTRSQKREQNFNIMTVKKIAENGEEASFVKCSSTFTVESVHQKLTSKGNKIIIDLMERLEE